MSWAWGVPDVLIRMLETLATELLLDIFRRCNSIIDVINLSVVCRRFHRILLSSQRLPILLAAAEAEFGPVQDIIQLVTHNSSQPAHIFREVPLSAPLIQQIVQVGRVALKWEEIFPRFKWRHNYEDRRLLSAPERYLLRRAIYRYWLYARAFHNSLYSRTTRLLRHVVYERTELLRNWSPHELSEIEDFRFVLRDIVQEQICPSDGTMLRKLRKLVPDVDPSHSRNAFSKDDWRAPNTHFQQQQHFFMTKQFADRNSCLPGVGYSDRHYAANEGWGDEIIHYYVVEDMLKLDPGQIMWLRENAPWKAQVEAYVKVLGEWFDNNGETFGPTLRIVMDERGDDYEEMQDAIVEEKVGIVCGGSRFA